MQAQPMTFQQPALAGPTTMTPRFRPYACATHTVSKGRYITSNDSRGYIPVYEYPLNGQWIMMDIDDGYVLWTGIWKALGHSKADIVKMLDSQPDLAPLIRRVRGGYLKIQGTWMPYEVALSLARRVAWPIRDDLIPLFGPTFPSSCLSPDQPGYGQVVNSNRRRVRRNTTAPQPQQAPPMSNWTPPAPFPQAQTASTLAQIASAPSTVSSNQAPAPAYPAPSRYAPYPTPRFSPSHSYSRPDQPTATIMLPPIRTASNSVISYALPPISALENLRGVHANDSTAAAVLKRLREEDDEDYFAARSSGSSTPSPRTPPPPPAYTGFGASLKVRPW